MINRSLFAALSFALIGTLLAGCSSASKRASHASPTTPSCAWPISTNAETLSKSNLVNIHNPDTASDYWLTTFTIQPGLRITLTGRYPSSRYMSFVVYTSHGTPFTTDGVASTLTDYRIAPDPGSVNPWQHPAPAGGRYTVTLRSVVTPHEKNTLPLAPAGTPFGATGIIFLRIYAATQHRPAQIPLPTVTFTAHGVAKQLPTCPATANPSGPPVQQVLRALGLPANFAQTTSPSTASPPATPGAAGRIVAPFAAYPAGAGGTVDTDIAYLSATIVPPENGDVLVIRGKAPTTPRGTRPTPWPAVGADMRYWSICDDLSPSPTPVVVNHLPDGTVDEGCRYDSQITLDADRYYTIVVGTESQREAIERIPGATFLPFSGAEPTQTHKLYMRDMIPNPAFTEAIQNVPTNGNPASAAAVMGPYYPQAGFCPLATLASVGPNACVTANR